MLSRTDVRYSENPEYIWSRSSGRMPDQKEQGGIFPQNTESTPNEESVGMFLYWVYGDFDSASAGQEREEFMDKRMKTAVNIAYARGLGQTLYDRIDPYTTGEVKQRLTQVVNIRIAPSIIGTVFDSLDPGETFSIIGKAKDANDWVLVVTQSGFIGWVNAQYINIEKLEGIPEISSNDPFQIGY